MPKFFFRTAPVTIQDAVQLSKEDFIKKYSDTTATEETLINAYHAIRAKELPAMGKAVAFKVIPVDNKVIAFNKPVEADNPISGTGTKEDPVVVRRGRKSGIDADKRNNRILELLKLEKKGKEIIEIMAGEGFTVHAPQITAVKQANNL